MTVIARQIPFTANSSKKIGDVHFLIKSQASFYEQSVDTSFSRHYLCIKVLPILNTGNSLVAEENSWHLNWTSNEDFLTNGNQLLKKLRVWMSNLRFYNFEYILFGPRNRHVTMRQRNLLSWPTDRRRKQLTDRQARREGTESRSHFSRDSGSAIALVIGPRLDRLMPLIDDLRGYRGNRNCDISARNFAGRCMCHLRFTAPISAQEDSCNYYAYAFYRGREDV